MCCSVAAKRENREVGGVGSNPGGNVYITNTHTHVQTDIQTDGRTDRQGGREAGRQRGRNRMLR